MKVEVLPAFFRYPFDSHTKKERNKLKVVDIEGQSKNRELNGERKKEMTVMLQKPPLITKQLNQHSPFERVFFPLRN